MDNDRLLEGLTEPQREAVVHVDGPLLIIAGAGSGKTRVITRRVAWLMGLGIPGPALLAITFTNKAAGEMKSRVGDALGRPVRDFGRLEQPWPTICTFHSLCLRILRHYAGAIGLDPAFAIYDSSDQNKLIKDAIGALDLKTANFTPSAMHAAISEAKNKLLSPEQYAANARDFYSRAVARVYDRYQKLLAQNNALDFDDLLLRTARAFRDCPEALGQLQEKYQYILIDEYQDTNRAQYIIAHALAQRHRNLCVVGDPDQSIYAWRGADIKNILEFERDYPDAAVVRLEQNYRSTKTVLAIASGLIAHNTQRKEKSLWTENPAGDPADLFTCQDEHDEAAVVTAQLRDCHERGKFAWSDMAVFYRMNSLSRVIEESLFKNKIPYQIARGVEFYNRKEIKDVLAYLRVVANPADEVSLRRIVNVPPRGLGEGSLKHLELHATARGTTLLNAMVEAATVPGLSPRAIKGAADFVRLVRRWRSAAGLDSKAATPSAADAASEPAGLVFEPVGAAPNTPGVRGLVDDVVRSSGLELALAKGDKDKEQGERAIDNVNELISSAAEFDAERPDASVSDYLAQVTLVSDTDRMSAAGGAVTLMTLHAAKGLEFPVVAIVGLEDGLLPHSRAKENPGQMEEERRLCFVGITRAERRLMMTQALFRTIRGLRERTTASRFLAEMPHEHLRIIDRTGIESPAERRFAQREARERFRSLADQHWPGQLVRHPKFGLGRVAEVIGVGQNARAVVQFNTAGRKTLVLEHAKLEAAG